MIAAVLVAGGIVGATRYITNFWLYRGFAPPSAPHSVVVRGPRGPRTVRVVLPTMQTITVTGQAIGGFHDPVYVVLPPGYASHPRQPVTPSYICCTASPASPGGS